MLPLDGIDYAGRPAMPPAAKRRRKRRLISVGWFSVAIFLLFVAFFDVVTSR